MAKSYVFTDSMKEPVAHFLKHFLDIGIEDEFEWSEYFFNTKRGAWGYQALYVGPEKTRLYGYPYDGKHCHLEIPGQLIEDYGTSHTIDYLKSLIDSDIVWRCTRIDVAFDRVPFKPKDCYDAWLRGDVKSKCHRNSWDWRQNSDGNTLYIGSRKPIRFLRIYDRRGFTRLELVFKDQWSNNFSRVITKIPTNEWIVQCIGYLRDYVDFTDSSYRKNKKETFLLPWWKCFVKNYSNIKLDIIRCNEDMTKKDC